MQNLKTKRIADRVILLLSAILVLGLLLVYALQSGYIPKEYDLPYEKEDTKPAKVENRSVVWVYYVGKDASVVGQKVLFKDPDVFPTVENRLITWRYLNNVGDGVEIEYQVLHNQEAIFAGGVLYESGTYEYATLKLIVSLSITEYPYHEQLLASLEKTVSGICEHTLILLDE